MSSLDAGLVRQITENLVGTRLSKVEVFAEIDSTNTYLMQLPGPECGQICIAVTNNQIAGRGRHGKTWMSPPGAGLCLSIAYTFAERPDNLPALTLALGLGAIDALEEFGAGGIKLKWPNDLVAFDRKLGGILTEVQQRSTRALSVVAGIGVNLDLRHKIDVGGGWSNDAIDLQEVSGAKPAAEELAGVLAANLLRSFERFAVDGFAPSAERWADYDWLLGRDLMIESAGQQLTGIGAGIAEDGGLLVKTADSGLQRISSGTVVSAGSLMAER